MGKNVSSKKVAIFAVVLVLLAAGLFSLWYFNRPQGQAGVKTVTVMVDNGTETRSLTIKTGEEFLGPALKEEGLVEGQDSDFGFYITAVDGVKADEGKQQWWCITKGGEDVMTGVDSTPIADGDTYELTLKTGY